MDDTTQVTDDTQTCAFPECKQPVAPPPETGRPSIFCVNPKHTAQAAYRARRHAAKPDNPEEGRHPVSTAHDTIRSTLDQAKLLAAQMSDQIDLFCEAIAIAADPEAAAAQIEATVSDAQQLASEARAATAKERAARITAERDARLATDAADEMVAQTEAMQTALTQERSRREDLAHQLAEITTERDHHAQAAQRAADRIQELEGALQVATERAEGAARTAAKEGEARREAERRADRAEATLTAVTADRDREAARAEQLDQELAKTTGHYNKTLEAFAAERTRADRLEEELTETKARAETAEHTTATERTARIEVEQSTRTAERRADRAEATAEQLTARLTTSTEQLGELRTELERLRTDVTVARERADRYADQLAQLATPSKTSSPEEKVNPPDYIE